VRVTIAAHDVGLVSGMERELVGLIEGLIARGVRIRVAARTCDVPSFVGGGWEPKGLVYAIRSRTPLSGH